MTHHPWKVLSIAQPYAELILRRRKHIEIRSWKRAYRGPLLIHASKKFKVAEARALGIRKQDVTLGAFVGVAELEDIKRFKKRHAGELKKKRGGDGWWAPKQYAWMLRRVKRIDPIPFKGRLNLFDPPRRVLLQLDKEKQK